jgi:AraC-like DNA-binding protein
MAFEYSLGQTRVLPRAIAVGPCDHRVADVLNMGRLTHFTVVFQPTGFFRLFHISPWEVRNFAYDCADVLGNGIAGLHARLCEATSPEQMVIAVEEALLAARASALPRSPMQSAATVFLRSKGRADLLSVADSLGLSDSSCRRHFSSEVGVTPKRYLRMLRFRHAIALKRRAAEKSWTQVCLEAGYYDQAHFIAECQALVSSSPSRYMRELEALPKAVAAAWYGSDSKQMRAFPAEQPSARLRGELPSSGVDARNYTTSLQSFGARVCR